MKILTCNIRYGAADDGDNSWNFRKALSLDVIRSREPDIFCFQELSWSQYAYFAEAFPAFATYAVVDEPVGGNPTNAIFYQPDRFRLLSASGYWLSHTPHVAGSSAWDSACIRLANWVQLEDRTTGVTFRVINTHLDHVSQLARQGQAQLIVEDAQAYSTDYPQILTGDMNCDAQNQAIDVFRSGGWFDTYSAVHNTEDPGHTFHEFKGPAYPSTIGKMDWIFARGKIAVRDAEVIRDAEDGRYPSDHYFVSATLELGTE